MQENIESVFRIICPDCNVYITYNSDEVKKAIENSFFTCKRCQKHIPVTMGLNKTSN